MNGTLTAGNIGEMTVTAVPRPSAARSCIAPPRRAENPDLARKKTAVGNAHNQVQSMKEHSRCCSILKHGY